MMVHPKLKIYASKHRHSHMEGASSSSSSTSMGSQYSASSTLITSLISMAKSLACFDTHTLLQKKNAEMIIRKLQILCILFEEINERTSILPPSAALCFHELKSTIQSLTNVLQDCAEGSRLWQLMENQSISHKFRELTEDMANALEILPFRLLNVSEEVVEQVQLVYMQLRRAKIAMDSTIEGLWIEVLCMVKDLGQDQLKPNQIRLERLIKSLNLTSAADCNREIRLLEDQILNQAGTGGVSVVCTISNLISFLKYCKKEYFNDGEEEEFPRPSCSEGLYLNEASMDELSPTECCPPQIPDEFKCPISLDLMMDPVIVATGHTYDRCSITKWIESGHLTCPKSGQKLLHVSLIPNYALRSIISQWCSKYDIPYEDHDKNGGKYHAVDHIESTRATLEATRQTSAFLVGKLATGSPETQKQVAYELRLLAKRGMENRMCIAEAGAVPFLVPLLNSKDHRTQENAVTALLNLSIFENNKSLIMAAGALDPIIEVLSSGATTECRENAAATLFSLSVVDENKVAIGSRPKAILGLINLLREGSSRGKKDAATALFNLSVCAENTAKVVAAGVIPLLIELLRDERAGITDDALAILAVLATSPEGLIAIRETQAIPVLVDLLRVGSEKGKENSISVLVAVCRSGGEDMIRYISQTAIASLQALVSVGSPRAKRKAASLLKLLNRYGPLNQATLQHSMNISS